MKKERRFVSPFLYAICVCFGGRPNGRRQAATRVQAISSPLQWILLYSVGAIHESPVFVCVNRLLAGRRGAVPYRLVVYTQKFVAFRTVGDAGPYKVCVCHCRDRRPRRSVFSSDNIKIGVFYLLFRGYVL